MSEDTPAPPKVPTRPNSKWATGRRREPRRYITEPKGFFRGAKVSRRPK